MSHPGHFKQVCSCGAVIAQCRCMSPDKRVEIVDRGCSACREAKAPRQEEPKVPSWVRSGRHG